MQFTVLSLAALLCSSTFVIAADEPSGRPGKVLLPDECQKAWQRAGGSSSSLSEDKARPYILNFQRVDTSQDNKISSKEWEAGCNKGWVSIDPKGSDKQG
jgi:hypothetical protein